MSLVLVKKKYEHFLSINTEINVVRDEVYKIHIVYYINCMVNTNYMDWLMNQINLVKDFGSAEIYVISTILQSEDAQFRENVLNMFPSVNIECYYENEFEYRGILKVWELGQIYKSRNDIILYFHSKGISHNSSYDYNRHDDYNIILKDINKIEEIFTVFPEIDKIGFNSGGIGWIWFNFWYARGSYINRVEKPIKTQRRHYYEDWLGRKVEIGDEHSDIERDLSTYYENTIHSCYGFSNDNHTIANIGTYYCPESGMIQIEK